MQTEQKQNDWQQDTADEFKALLNVVAELSSKDQDCLAQPLVELMDSHQRRNQILNLLRDATEQLRVDMKYLVFDLEATRAERDSLQEQIEQGLSS